MILIFSWALRYPASWANKLASCLFFLFSIPERSSLLLSFLLSSIQLLQLVFFFQKFYPPFSDLTFLTVENLEEDLFF